MKFNAIRWRGNGCLQSVGSRLRRGNLPGSIEIEVENRKIPNNHKQDIFIFYKGTKAKKIFFTP
jgi:hypothetical protein